MIQAKSVWYATVETKLATSVYVGRIGIANLIAEFGTSSIPEFRRSDIPEFDFRDSGILIYIPEFRTLLGRALETQHGVRKIG